MKANELRIGNHIINDGCICEILFLHGGKYDYCGLKTRQGGEINAHLDLIKPIPLTPEVLGKCGFESGETVFRKRDNLVISKDLSWIGIYSDRMDDDAVFNCPKYLHELQNLFFALTGEELEINL